MKQVFLNSIKSVVLGALLLFLASCGKENEKKEVFSSPPKTKATVQFDSSVQSDQKTLIEKDLANIASLSLSTPPTGEVASYFKLNSFDGASLSEWLRERVKYIVGEEYAESAIPYTSIPSPTITLAESAFTPFLRAETVMSNLGTAYWLAGKEKSRLYKLPINGVPVEVRGPRVGIIKIGEALFSTSNGKGKEAIVNSLRRISTYFHEARHSDGNGSHTGFTHALCKSGLYQNEYACEQFLNGPYILQSGLLDSFYKSCIKNGCDNSDGEAIRLLSVDKKSRLISGATYKDPTPERLQ